MNSLEELLVKFDALYGSRIEQLGFITSEQVFTVANYKEMVDDLFPETEGQDEIQKSQRRKDLQCFQSLYQLIKNKGGQLYSVQETSSSVLNILNRLKFVQTTEMKDSSIGEMLRTAGINISDSIEKWPLPLPSISRAEYPVKVNCLTFVELLQKHFDWQSKFNVVQKRKLSVSFLKDTTIYSGSVDFWLTIKGQVLDDQICIIPIVKKGIKSGDNIGQYLAMAVGVMCRNARPALVCVSNLNDAHWTIFFKDANLYAISSPDLRAFLQAVVSWLMFFPPEPYSYQNGAKDLTTASFNKSFELVRSVFHQSPDSMSSTSGVSGKSSHPLSQPIIELGPFLMRKDLYEIYDDCRITDIIGKGRNGCVYKSEYSNKPVAFKVCNITVKGEKILNELLHEVKIIRYLNENGFQYCPELLTEGFFEHESSFFYAICTTYIYAPISYLKIPDEAKDKCRKCLIELHKLNVIHGDIRVQNFLLGEGDLVHLIDFGFSQIQNDLEIFENELKQVEYI